MKKHILFFIQSLSGAGAEKVLVTLLKHIDYNKYKVTLMPLIDTGILRDEIDKSKLNYKPVICEAKNAWQRFWNKIRYKLIYHYLPSEVVSQWILPQKGVDVYIAFIEGFATKLISCSPKKKLAWVHADLKTVPWTLSSHVFRDLNEEQMAYGRFDKVVCVSNSVESVMREHYRLSNTMTIYNPIDKEDIMHKAKEHIDTNVSSSFNIVSVGRLVPEKGFNRLIPIIGKLRHDGKDVQLYIIGEGRERKHLENIIRNERMEDSVHLMGFMRNPYALMSIMDLFVCSSIAEGFSLVIAEAMTLGLPVISTECAGPNELLDYGNYGLLVDNSEQGLYDGINKLFKNSMLLNGLRQKSLIRSKDFGLIETLKAFYINIDNL